MLTLKQIAEQVGGTVEGDDVAIKGVAKIEEAKSGDITFMVNPKYAKYIDQSHASAVVVDDKIKETGGKPCIRAANPYYTFLKIVRLFHPPKKLIEEGVHPTAVVGEGTQLGKNVSIGPYVVIGRNCAVGDRTSLMPGVVVENNVQIGVDCFIYSHVSLRQDVILGNRVIIHNGTVIGSDGFGFALEDGRYHKIPQIGNVVIEDDVEIGANTTIDRATLGETRICKGVKLDNLVHVAHNCTIGENTVIAGQTGLSGSTHIGKNVRMGGQVGFAGHMTIGDGAAMAAQSGVSKDVPPGVMVSGSPARPHRETMRIQAATNKLPELVKTIKELKERIQQLEKNTGK